MKNINKIIGGLLLSVVVAGFFSSCGKKDDPIAKAEKKDSDRPSIAETKAIAEEAYIYGFPMIAGYKALYQFNVDKSSSQSPMRHGCSPTRTRRS